MRLSFVIFQFFIVPFILGLASSWAQSFELTQIDFKQFQDDIYFQKLMHYQPSLFGTLYGRARKGQADGDHFYFSPAGRWDLSAEAEASVRAFLSGPTEDPNFHPQCRFPERYRYLKEKLALQIENRPCPDFQEWMHDLDPVGVALVFASNFPNNPGSAMGHTFMRIISSKSSRSQLGREDVKHMDLLDYFISYAAVTNDTGGISYAFRGLFGGFLGAFSMEPYYMKVREYNEGEGRDLWEYELQIDAQSTKRMMAHFWEVDKNTFFYYYFLDENCSFHLLTILDVARPEWELAKNFVLYTVPFETIKVISNIPGAVVDIKYRPALPKRIHHLTDQLPHDQQAAFASVVSGEIPIEKYADRPLFLDAIAQYVLFKKIENKMHFLEGQETLYRRALILRAKLGVTTGAKKIEMPVHEKPDRGHGTSQIVFSAGYVGGRELEILSFRPALHDLLNRDAGFSPFSRLNVLQLHVHRYERKKSDYEYKMREITFFDSLSLVPISSYERPLSWGLRGAYQHPVDMVDRQTLQILPSGGYSFAFMQDSSLFYTLAKWNFEYAYFVKNKLKSGPWATLGSISNLNEKAKLNFELTFMSDLIGTGNFIWNLWSQLSFSYFLAQDLDIRFFCQRFQRGQKTGTSYFQNQIALGWTF